MLRAKRGFESRKGNQADIAQLVEHLPSKQVARVRNSLSAPLMNVLLQDID